MPGGLRVASTKPAGRPELRATPMIVAMAGTASQLWASSACRACRSSTPRPASTMRTSTATPILTPACQGTTTR